VTIYCEILAARIVGATLNGVELKTRFSGARRALDR
jgi:hypothetical protein